MKLLLLLFSLSVASAQYHYGAPSYTAPPLTNNYAAAPTPASDYHKEFFSYSAPAQEDSNNIDDLVKRLKKNLRVIFIRGLEDNSLENAAVNLASAAGDGRTAIYVLNKQPDLSNLAQQIQNAQSENLKKPDVHFVRYRTEADAQLAQHTIQSQFDALPGLSTTHADDTASVLNFASSAQSPTSTSNGYNYLAPQ